MLPIKPGCPFGIRILFAFVTVYSGADFMRRGIFRRSRPFIDDDQAGWQARHGTRAPTKKRLKALEAFATRLKVLVENVELNSNVIPSWMFGWKSPWTGKHKGGELIGAGETDLFELGVRTREKFPELFQEEYHPDIYPIKATQVPRASASSVAFVMGLFSGRGSLGQGHHRAFAVISESRASDIMLRFHDCCQSYKGCGDTDFCPFEVFKERIAAPHLKHDYNVLCSVKSDQPEQVAPASKFSQILNWIFPANARQQQKNEL